jgi:acyl carrier protein
MLSDEIIRKVNQTMAAEFEVDPSKLTPATHLGDDLELDSLDGVDLIAAMQRTFSVKIPEEDARKLRTMGDIYAFVEKLTTASDR